MQRPVPAPGRPGRPGRPGQQHCTRTCSYRCLMCRPLSRAGRAPLQCADADRRQRSSADTHYPSKRQPQIRFTLMAPFYEELCQGGGSGRPFECAPALVGVNVVRPVARSTLTPLARRRGMAPVPGPAGFLAAIGGGSVECAGPGSGLSEEPVSGVRPVALDFRVVPECPPGPACSSPRDAAPAASWRQATSDSRRRRQRIASIEVLDCCSLRR